MDRSELIRKDDEHRTMNRDIPFLVQRRQFIVHRTEKAHLVGVPFL